MSLLNCLKDFVPSESNLYSEDEMRDINIRVLEERGVTVDDIAQLAYGTQSRNEKFSVRCFRKKRSISCYYFNGEY